MQCNEGTDNANHGKHAHQVTLLTYIKLRKFGKMRYISNLLDFFGRSNFGLTKKKSFTRVSSRRKRCKLSTFVKRHERWESEILNLHVFLTINSLKTTYMYTFEQVLKCTEIVISTTDCELKKYELNP